MSGSERTSRDLEAGPRGRSSADASARSSDATPRDRSAALANGHARERPAHHDASASATVGERWAARAWLLALIALAAELALRVRPGALTLECQGLVLPPITDAVARIGHPAAVAGGASFAMGASLLPFALRRQPVWWSAAWAYAGLALLALALAGAAEWSLALATICECPCERTRALALAAKVLVVALVPATLISLAAWLAFWWQQLHARRAPLIGVEALRAVVVASLPSALTLAGLSAVIRAPSRDVAALASWSGLGPGAAIGVTFVGGLVLGAAWLRIKAPPESAVASARLARE